MGLSKYKYLVTIGCSQTYGQGLRKKEETWSYKLAKELGLEEINLSCNGAGWYYIKTILFSFINNNKDILHECFFILQKSTLERRINYEELSIVETDYFENYNINLVPPVAHAALGYKNWDKFYSCYHHEIMDKMKYSTKQNSIMSGQWIDIENVQTNLTYFPEHRHYPNSRHNWKIGINHDIFPNKLNDKFEELMLHWATEMYQVHLFLKSLDINHIMVDGYSPFLSYKLDFKNYYTKDEEYEWVNEFWSTSIENEDDPDDVLLYDFKNIKSGWIFDSIDIKNKIDDVVIWSLYQFKPHESEWNVDGGHAGSLGMDLIKDVIKKNLEEKGWF